MGVEKVKEYFETLGMANRVKEFEVSSATVELAAKALGCEPGHIAKTMSFLTNEGTILILTAGDARIDNKKYKSVFHQKAKMVPWESVEEYVGHAPGGVCPFAIKEGIQVYLDVSLKKYEVVYPAAGSSNSAVELSVEELEKVSGASGWVDVCRDQP